MPPGYPIASLNDSTYDGAHERRRVSHTHTRHSSTLPALCDWQLSRPLGGCFGGWVSWRTAWSAWTTFCWRVSTTCGRATTTWGGGTTRWALRDTWRWSLSSTGRGTSPPWRFKLLLTLPHYSSSEDIYKPVWNHTNLFYSCYHGVFHFRHSFFNQQTPEYVQKKMFYSVCSEWHHWLSCVYCCTVLFFTKK